LIERESCFPAARQQRRTRLHTRSGPINPPNTEMAQQLQ
jgi:hypothetical protein